MTDASSIRQPILAGIAEHADSQRAVQQQAYMKSQMPCAGLSTPVLRKLCKAVFAENPLRTADVWLATVAELWRRAHVREERYAAIELLLHSPYRSQWLTNGAIPLIRELVETGAWWDFVDSLASNAVGYLLKQDPEHIEPVIRAWAVDENLWIRRTAILAQLKFKEHTDWRLLTDVIEGSLHDNDFFARKAIGWALREYSKTAPDTVVHYIEDNNKRLSPLSKREGLKVLLRQGRVETVP